MPRFLARLILPFAVMLTPALAQPTSPPSSPTPVIKANAQLVVVDVVVTDKNQKPVHGLTAADFTLSEDNVPQQIKSFEAHTALTAADATSLQPMPVLPPGVFTNDSPAPTNGAANILLLDTLNTPMEDQVYVRQQLRAYLQTIPPGTRVAIFGLTTRLLLLQGFTSDPAVLKRLIANTASKGSPLLDDQVGGSGNQSSFADTLEDLSGPNDPITADLIANLREFDAQLQTAQIQDRAQYTLDAMNNLARYLANIPGRKNLVWFSGSFPLNLLPDSTLLDPFRAMGDSEDEFRDTVNLLSRAQVAVYPIDARGIINSPVFSTATGRNYTGVTGVQRMNQDNTAFLNSQVDEHSTMQRMAAATGGHAFFGTNDLAHAVASAIDDGSNFYTLAYTPTRSQHDGKFRHIKIQVSTPGYTLAYRQGYYADEPDKPTPPTAKHADATTASGSASSQSMRVAMARGAPLPTEIVMHVGVVPMTPADKTEDSPAPGNKPSPKMHGPYRRYSVNYQIDPNGLTFIRTPDGKIHADFDLIIFALDPDGALINSRGSSVRIDATVDQLKQLMHQGFIRHEEISTPVKGEYFLRIAVHDLHRDRYGAIEVATSAVKNVKPYTEPLTPAPK